MTIPITEVLQLIDHLAPIIIAVVAIFSGVGFWSWRTKKLDHSQKFMDHLTEASKKHSQDLEARLSQLTAKVDELYDSKLVLVREVAQLRIQLRSAREEITSLRGTLK